MKTLLFREEQLQAQKIVKTENAIYGYTDGSEVFAFEGITNFGAFGLSAGEEFDVEEPSFEVQAQQLREENEQLRMSQSEQDSLIMQLMLGGN